MIIKTYEEKTGIILVVMEDKEGNQFTLHTFYPAYIGSNLHRNASLEYAQNLADFMGISVINLAS